MKSNWQEEVSKFRDWAATQTEYDIDWEADYGEDNWEAIYESLREFFSNFLPENWTTEEIADLLYMLAHDTWVEIPVQLRENPEIALRLASESFEKSESTARLRLAETLGHLPPDMRTESLLLRFVDDEEEYVRRYALEALARINSPQTERLAIREWNYPNPMQQWSRMMALFALHKIHSPLFEAYLVEAEASPLPYLSDFARRLRNGEVESL